MMTLVAEILIILLGLVCMALGGMAFEDESDRVAVVMFFLGVALIAASHLAF